MATQILNRTSIPTLGDAKFYTFRVRGKPYEIAVFNAILESQARAMQPPEGYSQLTKEIGALAWRYDAEFRGDLRREGVWSSSIGLWPGGWHSIKADGHFEPIAEGVAEKFSVEEKAYFHPGGGLVGLNATTFGNRLTLTADFTQIVLLRVAFVAGAAPLKFPMQRTDPERWRALKRDLGISTTD